MIEKFKNSYLRLVLLVIILLIAGIGLMWYPEKTPILIIKAVGLVWILEGVAYLFDIRNKYLRGRIEEEEDKWKNLTKEIQKLPLDWNLTSDNMPEEWEEVLCAVTKGGMTTVDPSYEPTVDSEGITWVRLGEQVRYELLWREGDKWVSWDTDNYHDNHDYMYVIAWSPRLDFKLNKK